MGKYIEFVPINLQQTLYKICYTDNPYCLKPEVSWKLDARIQIINPYIQGIFKRRVWSYQKEYRYVIHLNGEKDFSPNKYYDLDLTDEALRQIKIVTSPYFSDGNKILLDNLLNKYGIENAPQQSSLYNLIR